MVCCTPVVCDDEINLEMLSMAIGSLSMDTKEKKELLDDGLGSTTGLLFPSDRDGTILIVEIVDEPTVADESVGGATTFDKGNESLKPCIFSVELSLDV